jgi:hypothetical protein
MPESLRMRFSKSANIDMDLKEEHAIAIEKQERPKSVIEKSLEQHIIICRENSGNVAEALELADLLKEEIQYRVRVYTNCLRKTSESYVKWLQDDYNRRLKFALISRNFHQEHEG